VHDAAHERPRVDVPRDRICVLRAVDDASPVPQRALRAREPDDACRSRGEARVQQRRGGKPGDRDDERDCANANSTSGRRPGSIAVVLGLARERELGAHDARLDARGEVASTARNFASRCKASSRR
jgi:hypothetical protein